MAKRKSSRAAKQQLGQFMTPMDLVDYVLDKSGFVFRSDSKILEPSLGEGAFVFAVIDRLLALDVSAASSVDKVKKVLAENLYGVEFDEALFDSFKAAFFTRYSVNLDEVAHNFVRDDFFRYVPPVEFDFVVGNPPFGGTFDPAIEDALDKKFGIRDGYKIKKETYSFFTVACVEMLAPGGLLSFVLSDTFLTINTMQGLRRFAAASGTVSVRTLEYFSEETDYGMAVLSVRSGKPGKHLLMNKKKVALSDVELTPNYSWRVDESVVKYFGGSKVGDFVVASSGMTIGRNEWFLRPIDKVKACVDEPYAITIVDEPVTVAGERARARLGKLSDTQVERIKKLEAEGVTRKTVQVVELGSPKRVSLPHADYAFYNKAQDARFFAQPDTVVFWKNDGEAVYAFKKSGPWYLHGVGGKPFFKKEGFTWNLISSTVKARYLPAGFILDSGAPVGVLRDGVSRDELWFILGWLNTAEATRVLKTVINHTKNIQSKDIERLPYPWWVSAADKATAISSVMQLVADVRAGACKQEDIAARFAAVEKLYAL